MSKPGIIRGIDPEEPFNSGVDKITRARIQELLSFADGSREGRLDAVHDMRVACRRLLSVLKIFKGAAGIKAAQARKLKKLFRTLREVRECDVFINVLKKFTKEYGRSAAAARMTREYSEKRKSAGAGLTKTLKGIESRMTR